MNNHGIIPITPDISERFFIPWPEGAVSAGQPMARVGWRLQIYFRNPQKTKTRDAIYKIAQEYISLSEGNIRKYYIGSKEIFRDVKQGQSPDLTPLEKTKEGPSWCFKLTGATEPSNSSPWGFQAFASQITFRADELGDIIVYFPISAFQTEDFADKISDLFVKWCSMLEAEHGYAGLGWILPLSIGGQNAAVRLMGPNAMYYLGLDVDLPSSTSIKCQEGIRSVSWLTAVSNRLLAKIGGVSDFSDSASQVRTLPYESGLVFQAGAEPQQKDLSAYRNVTKLLKELSVSYGSLFDAPMDDPAFTHMDAIHAAQEYSRQWLSRFE